MRAIYFTESLGNGSKGGGSISSIDFLDLLLENYSEVTVCHFGNYNPENDKLDCHRLARHRGVRINSWRSLVRWLYYFVMDIRFIMNRIDVLESDHLFVNSWPSCLKDLSINRRGCRVVLVMRGSVGFFSRTGDKEALKRIRKEYENWMIDYTDIIFVSRNIVEPWVSFLDWNKGIHYLPNTVDREILEDSTGYLPDDFINGGVNVLLLGSVQSRKNQGVIREAAEYFKDNPVIRFHIVGAVSKTHGGCDIVQELDKFKNIIFHGFQSDVSRYIAHASICLLTSVAEASPRSLLSYIKLGKVVVASNIDGNSEIIVDNFTGYLFDPENGQELIDKLLFAMENAKRESIEKNAITHYQLNYSQKVQADYFKEIVSNLC